MKLLLIEDDKRECEKFKNIVDKRDDIEFVGITNSSEEGLKILKNNRIDAIILDLELNAGKGSGFELLQNIKKL